MYDYRATYLKNYDGDTISFKIDVGFKMSIEMNIRLLEVDTFEIRDKNEFNIRLAKEARDFVHDVLSNAKSIIVKTHKDKKEKYGRYLARVIYFDKNSHIHDLAEELISRKLTTGKYEKQD